MAEWTAPPRRSLALNPVSARPTRARQRLPTGLRAALIAQRATDRRHVIIRRAANDTSPLVLARDSCRGGAQAPTNSLLDSIRDVLEG